MDNYFPLTNKQFKFFTKILKDMNIDFVFSRNKNGIYDLDVNYTEENEVLTVENQLKFL